MKNSIREISLTEGYVALVDENDFAKLAKHTWCVDKRKNTAYALRVVRVGGRQKSIRMHRVILKCAKNQHVDHRDGNGLNNTRANLRIATKAKNGQNRGAPSTNTTGFKGVFFHRRARKFQASIVSDGVTRYLGLFSTAEAAHRAYQKAALKYHKEFARFK